MTDRDRRRLLALTGTLVSGTLAGCGSLFDDDSETTTRQQTVQTTSSGTATTERTTTDPEQGTTTTRSTTTTEAETTTETTTTETTTTETTTTTVGALDTIEILDHSLFDAPASSFTEGRIRSNGKAAVFGTKKGHGTYLVDLRDPTDISLFHRLDSTADNRDVKFDPLRFGLYYRGEEFRSDGDSRVQLVDYGYDSGTPGDPQILANVPAGDTHNLHPHPGKPLLYTVNGWPDTPLFDTWDVSDPSSPRRIDHDSEPPAGHAHELTVDPVNDHLHVAVMEGTEGQFEGYLIYDIADPERPTRLGAFDYRDAPDYTAIGEPGFENCHAAVPDPERGLVVVGDEVGEGIPGGKHVFDIGWNEGSPANPTPVGFTHSPNAQVQDGETESLDWTGHNFDFVTVGDHRLLVSGDYHEGVVLYDLGDPRNPTPLTAYRTDEGADRSNGPADLGAPPMAWSAHYADEAGVGVASDMLTGAYVFRLV